MTPTSPETRALDAILRLPDEAIDLAQAALLIARQEYPDLQVGRYLALLDDMAGEVRSRLRGGEGATSRIAHLNRFLFDDLGFRGNVEEYHDPRNSFLNDVLDRRVGIPISLSAVYLEVGARCGFPIAGVSFPGHFLVRYNGLETGGDLFIDPFNRGALMTEDDCRRRIETAFGGRLLFRPEMLRRARNREILERMLVNLALIYQKERDLHRALRVQNSLLALHPCSPRHLKERGLLHGRMALTAQAVEDLEACLQAQPDAPDAAGLRDRVRRLRLLVPVMN